MGRSSEFEVEPRCLDPLKLVIRLYETSPSPALSSQEFGSI